MLEDAIANALQLRPQKLPLRATFDRSAPEAYADNKQLDRVHSDNWQIIFGRRGAGKTTILANYAHYVTYLAKSLDDASVELVGSNFLASVAAIPNSIRSDTLIAHVYFGDFMGKIAEHFWSVWDDQDRRSKFYRRYLTADSRRKQHIEDLILQLKESTLSPTEQIDSPNAWLVTYYRSRDILLALLASLHIRKMYLIIDEWSELDRSASTKIQPIFAGLLKSVFGNSPTFIVKIGAVRKQTQLGMTTDTDGIVGLEIGADIFVIDLDQVYTANGIDRRQFFEDLVFQHLAYCDERLRAFARPIDTSELLGRTYLKPVDTFITHIFRSKEDFGVLIEGAGGLPRDFIEMLDSLAQQKQFSVQKPWTRADVQQAIRSHFTSRKLTNLDGNPIGQSLYEKLVKIVEKTRSRTVLVPKGAEISLRMAVGDFYHKRMLHDVRTDFIPAGAMARFDVYNVDLGLVYHIFPRDAPGSFRDDEGWHLPQVLTPDVFANYTVD